ncbi:hypothetical protein ACET3Z_025729 [Daucus carota]
MKNMLHEDQDTLLREKSKNSKNSSRPLQTASRASSPLLESSKDAPSAERAMIAIFCSTLRSSTNTFFPAKGLSTSLISDFGSVRELVEEAQHFSLHSVQQHPSLVSEKACSGHTLIRLPDPIRLPSDV